MQRDQANHDKDEMLKRLTSLEKIQLDANSSKENQVDP